MPRRKQIYKITYPNGKVYVGTVAIGNYHDSGNTHMIRAPLGILAAFFDRLGRYEPAAISAGFAVTSPVAALPAMADFGTATGCGDDRHRHGDLRTRPNRPGPSRTGSGLETDEFRESQNFVSEMARYDGHSLTSSDSKPVKPAQDRSVTPPSVSKSAWPSGWNRWHRPVGVGVHASHHRCGRHRAAPAAQQRTRTTGWPAVHCAPSAVQQRTKRKPHADLVVGTNRSGMRRERYFPNTMPRGGGTRMLMVDDRSLITSPEPAFESWS